MDSSNPSNLDDQKVDQICDDAIGRINARRRMVKKYLGEHTQEKSAMLSPILNNQSISRVDSKIIDCFPIFCYYEIERRSIIGIV
jgi:hypothetical protein